MRLAHMQEDNMSIISKDQTTHAASGVVAVEEFVELTGISPEHLEELLALDWLETRLSATKTRLFRDADIYRVRKLERICCDFELPVIGGTIIVDLLERIDRLERLVSRINHFED